MIQLASKPIEDKILAAGPTPRAGVIDIQGPLAVAAAFILDVFSCKLNYQNLCDNSIPLNPRKYPA